MPSTSTSQEQDASLSLAIVGGGIAGLLLALSTANHAPKISITLYEAASKFGEIGAGVAFGPNAARAMSKISPDVERGFDNVKTGNLHKDRQNVYFSFRTGMEGNTPEAKQRGVKPGKVIYDQTFRGPCEDWGRGMVHRAAYLDEMIKLLPNTVKVEFGKRLVDLEDQGNKVLLKFKDGSQAAHAAIIGCDGIKSRVRTLLLGPDDPTAQAAFTGKYCYRGLIPMDEAIEHIGEEAAANSTMYHGYGGHMLTFPVQKGKTMNVVAFSSTDTWDSDEWVVHADRDKMFKDFEGWGPIVRTILELMQKPDIWALFNHKSCHAYYKNRVCIAGDAAHASTPHQGSGAGMAVEDAYLMSMILREVKNEAGFSAAFASFDKVRRPRTQKLVTTSKECGMAFDFELDGIGDDLEKLKDNLTTRMDWIWNKDIDEDVEDALEEFRARVAELTAES